MQFSQVAQQIEKLRPDSSAGEIAQLSILALNLADGDEQLSDEDCLFNLVKDGCLRLRMSNEHHAAVREELKEMTQADPKGFQKEQIWTLVRAINVQDQLLQMFAGLEPLDA